MDDNRKMVTDEAMTAVERRELAIKNVSAFADYAAAKLPAHVIEDLQIVLTPARQSVGVEEIRDGIIARIKAHVFVVAPGQLNTDFADKLADDILALDALSRLTGETK